MKTFVALAICFCLVSAGDVYLTTVLIRTGDFEEINPVPRMLIRQHGLGVLPYYKAATVILTVLLPLSIILQKRKRLALTILGLGVILTGAVVGYSLYLLWWVV